MAFHYLSLYAGSNLPSINSRINICKSYDTFQAIFASVLIVCVNAISTATLEDGFPVQFTENAQSLNIQWLQAFYAVCFPALKCNMSSTIHN